MTMFPQFLVCASMLLGLQDGKGSNVALVDEWRLKDAFVVSPRLILDQERNALQLYPKLNKTQKKSIDEGLGDAYYAVREFQKARKYYSKVVESDPSNAAMICKVAKTFILEAEAESFSEHLEKALAVDKKSPEALSLLAVFGTRDAQTRENIFRVVRRLAPELSLPDHVEGGDYIDKKQYEKAMPILDRLIRRHPIVFEFEPEGVYAARATGRNELSRNPIPDCVTSLRIQENFAARWTAIRYYDKHDRNGLVQYYSSILSKHHPKDLELRKFLIEWDKRAMNKGKSLAKDLLDTHDVIPDYAIAIDAISIALSDPQITAVQRAAYHELLADYSARQSQFEKAVKSYGIATKLDTSKNQARAKAALLSFYNGSKESPIMDVNLIGRFPMCKYTLCAAAAQTIQTDRKKTLFMLESSLKIDPSFADAKLVLAEIEAMEGQSGRALDRINSLVEESSYPMCLVPERPYMLRAKLYMLQNEIGLAFLNLTIARLINPSSLSVRQELSQYYQKTGKRTLAEGVGPIR